MNSFLKKKITLRQKKEKLHKIMVSSTFRISLVICVVVFGFMYVWQTNTVSTKGFAITDLEKSIQELEYETRKLEVDIAKYKSMQSLQNRVSETSLVVVTDVDYMTVVGSAVARN